MSANTKIMITIVKPQRPKPKAGDRRTTKAHGLQIRVQAMARGPFTGKPLGRVVSNGRPVFDWRKPIQLDAWDRHHLTPEELEQFFPGEQGGAA